MKKILVTIPLLLFLVFFTILPKPLYAGYKEGVAAYIRSDYKTAFRELKASAEKGVAWAQFTLGLMYFNGEGVTRDYKEALKWFRKAAEQGNALAQFALGEMYYSGDGSAKNYVLGYKWLNLAASSGDDSARSMLDELEKKMTPEQIAEAQKLSKEFKAETEK